FAFEVAANTANANTEQLAKWFEQLGGESNEAAHRAAWSLSAVGDKGVAFLKTQTLVVPDLSEKVRQLLPDLDAGEFSKRTKASEQIAALAESALPELRKAQKLPLSADAANRIENLIMEC